jgi:hypothetical protein
MRRSGAIVTAVQITCDGRRERSAQRRREHWQGDLGIPETGPAHRPSAMARHPSAMARHPSAMSCTCARASGLRPWKTWCRLARPRVGSEGSPPPPTATRTTIVCPTKRTRSPENRPATDSEAPLADPEPRHGRRRASGARTPRTCRTRSRLLSRSQRPVPTRGPNTSAQARVSQPKHRSTAARALPGCNGAPGPSCPRFRACGSPSRDVCPFGSRVPLPSPHSPRSWPFWRR